MNRVFLVTIEVNTMNKHRTTANKTVAFTKFVNPFRLFIIVIVAGKGSQGNSQYLHYY